ncbi:MAG: hypothetical protein ACPGVK_04835 [Halocynthiibacter sp.]
MTYFEYKAVAQDVKPTKEKGVKSLDGRIALTVQNQINELALDGWVYQSMETFDAEERSTFGKRSTQTVRLMLFRREIIVQPPNNTDEPTLAAPIMAPETFDAPKLGTPHIQDEDGSAKLERDDRDDV